MSDEGRDDLLGDAADEVRRAREGGDDFDDEFESGSQNGGGKKKLLFILLPILLLGGIGAGVYFSGILDDKSAAEVKAEEPAEPEPVDTVFFNLPDMLVNLNTTGSKPNFLKLRASLEIAADADVSVLTAMTPRIIDKFQIYLRELRLDDLRGDSGLSRLREELRARVNEAVSPVEVKDIVFQNMLVQ